MNDYLARARELKEETVAHRRRLHSAPEVGMELANTTAYVVAELKALGYEPKEVCKSGVTVTVGGKRGGKTLLLRADMDALPMREESGLDFASTCDAAHTCGHDMHTAMLLTAAKMLKEREDELEGTVKLMFQPDEEGLTGAKAMLDGGLLDEPVDAAMAIHVSSGASPVGGIGYAIGPMAASSDIYTITVKGHGGHGAMPHTTRDPINAAAHIYIALQEINAREVNPTDPIVITIGSFNSGDAPNIIPEKAVMKGTIRAFSRENRELAKRRLVEIAEQTAKLFRCECTVDFVAGTPANISDEKVTRAMLSYIEGIAPGAQQMPKMMGSEDFAYISDIVPACFLMLAAGGEEEIYHRGGQHNPKVVFNEDALPYGAAYHAVCAESWLRDNK